MGIIISILSISILLQVLSAFFALRLINATGYRWPWIALAIAIMLMAFRRIVSFYQLLHENNPETINPTAEIVALIISILMLYGILNIGPIIKTLFKAQNNLQLVNKQLREEIEHRKEAEHAANISEEKFRKLTENSPIYIWMSDETGQCNYFNSRWLEFRGRTMAQENGMGWTEGLHQDDKDKTINIYLEAFQKRENFELEYRIRNNEGEFRWFYDIGTPLYNDNGEFYGYIGSCVDLTDRKKMEQALRESEEKYHTIFDNAPVGIFRSTREGKFLEVNNALANMLGYDTPEEVINTIKDIGKQIYVKTNQRSEIINEITESETIHSYENTYKRKDGSHFVANLLVKFIKDQQGHTLFLEGIVEEITEKKEAEEALKKSEAQKALILGSMIESLVYMDSNLRVKWLNKAAKKLVENEYQTVEGYLCHEIWHGQKEPCPNCPAVRTLKSGKVEEAEVNFQNRIFSVRTYPVKRNGKIDGLIEIGHDITERKQAEQALKESENKFRKIVNTLPQYVSYTDKDLIYRFVNKTYLENFDLKEDDIIGKNIVDIIGDKAYKKAKPHLEKVFSGERVSYKELFKYKDGRNVHMEGTLVPQFNENNEVIGYYAILSDISHHIQNQQLLEESRNKLRILSEHQQNILEKERKYIAREIHDELGQNLTAISMGLAMMKRNLPRQERTLFTKLKELMQLTQTTISKIKRLSTELRPQLIDDMGLLPALEWYVNNFQKQSGITCEVTFPDEEVQLTKNTAINIYRIVQESLTNIYKHSGADMAKISLEIAKNELILQISDNGKGISESDLKKPESLGIIGIEERVHLLHGEMNLEGSEKGTFITIKIPTKQYDQSMSG